MDHGDLRRPRCRWGAAICETVATFVGSWEGQQSGGPRGPEEAPPSLGGCDLRNCRHFRGLLGGPAEWGLTQTQIRPRHPWGAAICETVATFEGCWGVQRSDVLRRFRLDLAIPEGLRSAKLSPLSEAAGGPSGAKHHADAD